MESVQENYLKRISTYQRQSPYVSLSVLAEDFDVSKSAVNDIVKKLERDAYLDYVPYKGVRLTVKGQMKGADMIRRHRLWEMYLHQVLGFSWDEVHEEAERLEHASSDTLINRLDEVLQFPEFDPHGDPIPGKDGTMPSVVHAAPLSSLELGDKGRITRVSDSDQEFLKYLDEISVNLGSEIQVKEQRDFDRSMVIQVGCDTHTISHFSAQNIFIATQ